MKKWESRTEDLGFFPKNEVAFLAFLAFSLLKPMQNGFFLLGFLPKKPCSPYIKYSMAFLAFTWLFPRGKSQGKSRSYPYFISLKEDGQNLERNLAAILSSTSGSTLGKCLEESFSNIEPKL